MTQPIDVAYVDIVARDKSLDKMRKDIDKKLKEVEKDVQKNLDKIDEDFDDTFAEIDKHFASMTKHAEGSFKELNSIVEETMTEVEVDVKESVKRTRKHFGALGDDVDGVFSRIKNKIEGPLKRAATQLGEFVGDVSRGLGQLGGSIFSAVSSNPLLALILVLTPAIIALAGALSQLIGVVGVLPAGLFVLISAIVPVVVAFQNFGDAVGALAEGDIEKIDEALKKLSPSAAAVAREIASLLPMLRSFQRVVQESFFKQIRGDVFNVIREFFPVLEKGFSDIAASMGRLISGFASLLSSTDTLDTFRLLFASTARIIDKLSLSFVIFTDMLFNTVKGGLPFVERIADAFGRALVAFSNFVNESIKTGDFNKFIEDAFTTIKELIDLVKALGGLLGTLFDGTEEEGHSFIKSLTEMTVKLDEFLQTADGKLVIDALVFSVKVLAISLLTALQTFEFLVQSVRRAIKMFELIGRGVVDFVQLMGEWFGKLPGFVTEFIEGIPDFVAKSFQEMIDRVLFIIGVGIGLILFTFQELPKQIGSFLMSLPQRIYDILVQIGPLVGLAIQGAVDFGRNLLVNGFNEMVDFVLSVPDRLKALVPTFGKSGLSLIQSFMNGFRSVGHFIGDVAGDIVGAVKGFLNKAIDKINSGIATIDAILPGDLGRIPRLASGALIRHRPGGILANVGEGKEDEVVAPLSKLDDLVQGGTTINIQPGAVQVNFSGVVPMPDEARQVGESIIQGMAGALQRRNLRAQVRAI